MFGRPGRLYVYFTYGMHWCANVVCGPAGEAAAVLLRAGEVVVGLVPARDRRPAARADRDLARGPVRLATALGIDGAVNGTDLLAGTADGTGVLAGAGPVTLTSPVVAVAGQRIRSGPRVGVTGGRHTPWRFWLDGDPTVSRYRSGS